jgi:predicted NBD/HSP70 family sugar kinase
MPSSVGVDVGGTTTRAVAFDEAFAPGASLSAPTPRGADAIADLVVQLIADLGGDGAGARLERVAIGIPGRVDAVAGVVSAAVNLGITEPVPLASILGDRLTVPVHVENDVNAAALGAFSHLALPPAASLAFVNVGTGIAAGFVVGGRLWRGATGGAGEIGHIPMRPDGPPCRCGQLGCAEALGSGRAVADDPQRRVDVAAAAAWTVQLCVMALDVDVVVVGGGMTHPGDAFVEALRDVLDEREATSPMLGTVGLARRVVGAPPDVPLGSLGAVLAGASEHEAMT